MPGIGRSGESHIPDAHRSDADRSGAAASIAFVTGVDAEMFGQIFLLMGSLRRHSPGIALHVCDLGLTEPQRDYLRRTGRLLGRPVGRPLPRHPWYDKAALGAYVGRLEADVVVWLDADMIVLTDIAPPVAALCAEMQARDQIVAAAGDKNSIFSGLDWIDQAPGFQRALSRLNLDEHYLNSGLIICRSRELLARWAALCDEMPFEFLFEQNAFNLAAYEQPGRLRMLDPWVWNLCGPDFRSVEIVPSGEDLALFGRSGMVNILHATSNERAKDLCHYDYYLKVGDTEFRPQFRVVTGFEPLVEYQFSLVVECIAAETSALVASGFGSPGERMLGIRPW